MSAAFADIKQSKARTKMLKIPKKYNFEIVTTFFWTIFRRIST